MTRKKNTITDVRRPDEADTFRARFAAATIGAAKPSEVEQAETAFNTYARQAEAAPHRWGMEQEDELDRLAQVLADLYDRHDVAEYDRIAGV
jgi:hypothetical protein